MVADPKYLLDQRYRDPQLRAGRHRCFLSLPSATMEGYQRESGIFVAPDLQRRIEEKAAVIGTVVAADPKLGLNPGEKVAVDYRVVGSGKFMGEDRDNMSFVHDRAWIINDQLVWEAKHGDFEGQGKIYELIAVQREGKWHSLGHYALLNKTEVPNPNFIETSIPGFEIPGNYATVEVPGQGTIACEGVIKKPDENMPVAKEDLHTFPVGSRVAFNPQYGSVYPFENGEEYLVVPIQFIDGF